ncbi:dihydrodipicolinate synthase family protein [Pluralibacter gergoviae]|uniref:dihydrodipicolinate synthase family protein n=1 Tax=Pluralibacter gergoviae TaxID=61647 RepID=UPI000651E19D|nr:dihydrodipicolinate synthase family protein [Pluralibacter gergoviae]EKV0930955.1 dihydrodipicolinate synthase family protein [Pluralibacter gergoviae]EKV6247606.1 dihydrodipicolinate synthase family protein [Pluralibacter gergoviae]EKW9965700.1 dihydrodipicolinate synthase family protein [Pluralibacter gergoviae]ELD4271012.1 dihydrodipicolinate synthase family protein [Pluralibacter gergoviae]ELD4276767.1 dihydrodipicolinate synthase family protein [Pluralibacter gergoviae]
MPKNLFQGLCAFPLTPLRDQHIDEAAFTALLARLTDAGVDALGVLGSTGSYAYLSREERARITRLAVENAGDTPVMVSIGALRLDDILYLADDAQRAGVSGVMLAPVSYQTPTQDEAFRLYERVTAALSVPLCVYENVPTTGFTFSDELLTQVARLPGVGAIKLNRLPADKAGFAAELRTRLPAGVALGVSGDRQSPSALAAGFDVWFSVLGGLFPRVCLAMTRAARRGDPRGEEALAPLWALFDAHGSLRVVAAAAEIMGVAAAPALPFPLQAIGGEDRRALEAFLATGLLS